MIPTALANQVRENAT